MGGVRGYRLQTRCVNTSKELLLIYSELGNDLWRQNPVDNHYDYKLIYSRLQGLLEAQENRDVQGLMYIIRSGMFPCFRKTNPRSTKESR